jgi:DNA-binding transcriptional ArsR family regulator
MPIDKVEFEKSGRETSVLLMEFFRFNPRIAFTLDEVVEMLASIGRKLPAADVERTLLSLEYGGGIESREVDGVTYYRLRRVLGFTPMRKLR